MRETGRAPFVFGLVLVLAGCDPDDGKPTEPIKYLVPDAGDASTSALPDANRPLGADCTDASQCASGICFLGGKSSWCSTACTPDNAAQVCNVQPLDGTCNKQGLCRRP